MRNRLVIAWALLAAVLACASCTTGGEPKAKAATSRNVRQAIHGAGPCSPVDGSTAVVWMEPDGPLRDCLVVTPRQHLEVVNDTGPGRRQGTDVSVRVAGQRSRVLVAGAETTYPARFSAYFTQGFHTVHYTVPGSGGSGNVLLYLCTGRIVDRPSLTCVFPR